MGQSQVTDRISPPSHHHLSPNNNPHFLLKVVHKGRRDHSKPGTQPTKPHNRQPRQGPSSEPKVSWQEQAEVDLDSTEVVGLS